MKFCEHTLSLNLLPSRLALPQQPADSIWSDLKALVVPRGRFWEGCSRGCGWRCRTGPGLWRSCQPESFFDKNWTWKDNEVCDFVIMSGRHIGYHCCNPTVAKNDLSQPLHKGSPFLSQSFVSFSFIKNYFCRLKKRKVHTSYLHIKARPSYISLPFLPKNRCCISGTKYKLM